MCMLILILRTFIIYIVLIALMRILGKRQLGELELSELIVSILAADVVSIPLQNPDLSIWHGILPCTALIICEYVLAWLTMKSVAIRKLTCGKPCFLIIHGKIQQQMMHKCRFTVDELAGELRKSDVTDISDVEYAVLETDGTLNVILYPGERPATAAQMGLDPEDDGYAVILIEDGALLRQNLKLVGKNETWLQHELESRGCKSPRSVYAFIVYKSGKIYFAKKE